MHHKEIQVFFSKFPFLPGGNPIKDILSQKRLD